MKKHLEKILLSACEALGVDPLPAIDIEIPREKTHGDLSTPMAMGLSKVLKRPPGKIAEEIVARIGSNESLAKIEIAGPGFINFTFTREFLLRGLRGLVRKERELLRTPVGNGKKVLVEFVSANPTGPLHIGHARGAAVGNALCNLLSESGYRVEREYYVNDAGRQVKLLAMSVFARYAQLQGREAALPEDGYKGQYIDEEASALSEKFGSALADRPFEESANEITDWCLARMLKLIRTDLAKFGIADFTTWTSEREMHVKGDVAAAIEALRARGDIYEKDNAVWFTSSRFGDDKDRVVRKADGEHTYFASDIAYHKNKLDRGYGIIVDIWGADHHGYIPRIESVMRAFGYDTSAFKVILVQMVNLLRNGQPFQMSKRAGTFVTLSDMLDLVGADITKFIFLTRKSDSHLDFDLDVVTATSAENPVFYVQYANARISSVMANAAERGLAFGEDTELALLSEPLETELVKKLLAYPMVLESAARAFEPHRITFYLQELAGLFHSYYHDFRILADDPELARGRLFLCEGVRTIIADALGILGVTAPERM